MAPSACSSKNISRLMLKFFQDDFSSASINTGREDQAQRNICNRRLEGPPQRLNGEFFSYSPAAIFHTLLSMSWLLRLPAACLSTERYKNWNKVLINASRFFAPSMNFLIQENYGMKRYRITIQRTYVWKTGKWPIFPLDLPQLYFHWKICNLSGWFAPECWLRNQTIITNNWKNVR